MGASFDRTEAALIPSPCGVAGKIKAATPSVSTLAVGIPKAWRTLFAIDCGAVTKCEKIARFGSRTSDALAFSNGFYSVLSAAYNSYNVGNNTSRSWITSSALTVKHEITGNRSGYENAIIYVFDMSKRRRIRYKARCGKNIDSAIFVSVCAIS